MPLTDREIKNTKTDSKDIFLNDGRGLYLRVRSSGQKVWLYRYKVYSNTTWLELGVYPSMSLADARLNATKAKSMRDNGEDPLESRKLSTLKAEEEKKSLNERLTVQKVYDSWFSLVVSKHADKGQSVQRIFNKDVLPAIGYKKADEITRRDITALLDQIVQRGSLRMANVTLSLLKQMFAFSFVREIVSTDPTYLLKKKDFGGSESARERALSEDEILELHKNMQLANLYLPSSFAIYIVLSTSCRIGELIKALWKNVNLKEKTWLIPSHDSKNGKEHTIYLSDFAVSYFEKLHHLKSSTIFLYPNADDDGHIDTRSITKQIRDRQLDAEEKRLTGRSKHFDSLALSGGKWTPHDLRRTSATLMVSLGVSPDVVEKCLNHTEENKMKKTYQRYDYSKEQKAAWLVLGQHLSKLIDD